MKIPDNERDGPLDYRVTVWMNAEMDTAVRELAEQNGVSIAEIVRTGIDMLTVDASQKQKKKRR